MNRRLLVGLAAVAVVCMLMPCELSATYWDSFTDGVFERTDPNGYTYDANDPYFTAAYYADPNNWDYDNPSWDILDIIGISYEWNIGSDDVADRALRMSVVGYDTIVPMGFIGAVVETDDTDPNTSQSFWDDTADHYCVAWCYYTGHLSNNNPDDPNEDKGRVMIIMHTDVTNWWGISMALEFDAGTGVKDENPHCWHAETQGIDFTKIGGPPWSTPFWNFERIWVDPNAGNPGSTFPDANDPTLVKPTDYDDPKWLGVQMNEWERTGFWMLSQFAHDPNYVSGDPNGKYARGAIWHGGKFDWDGEYLLNRHFGQSWASGSKTGYDTGLEWYRPDGVVVLGVFSDIDYQGGYPGDAAYDHIEARTGVFTNVSRMLQVSEYHGENGDVTIDPDLFDDPNDEAHLDPNDPNIWVLPDPNATRRYTDGTQVVLTAVPLAGKLFLKWKYWDMATPGTATEDTNAVLYLVMDADYGVEAQFKCGSSVPPFVAMMLLALGVGVVIRRVL